MVIRQERFHKMPGVSKTDGVMAGRRRQQRKDREFAFRAMGSKEIEVISKVPAVPVGIPSNVTVRLRVPADPLLFSFGKILGWIFLPLSRNSPTRSTVE